MLRQTELSVYCHPKTSVSHLHVDTQVWELIYFLPTKDVKSGVQKIEGPLWKVPRCRSVFISTLNVSGSVFIILLHMWRYWQFVPLLSTPHHYYLPHFTYFISYFSLFCINLSEALPVIYDTVFCSFHKHVTFSCVHTLCWFTSQSSRFLGWRSHWVVLEDGTLSWYQRQWDTFHMYAFLCMYAHKLNV